MEFLFSVTGFATGFRVIVFIERKLNRRHEFKSGIKLLAFHFAPMPGIHLFKPHLWDNNTTEFFSLGQATSVGE